MTARSLETDTDLTLFDGSNEPDPYDGAFEPAASQTWSVAELHDVVDGLLSDAFGNEIWVEGEIRNLNRSKNGHVYFDLVDSDRAGENYPPILSITLFDRVRQSVNRFLKEQGGNVRVSDGVRVRIKGQLRVYASRSSLQLRMTGIDPKFTLGVLEQMRQQVLAALGADDLLERNRGTELSPVPSRVAMVTSLGSAAHADAMHEFDGAGLGIELFLFDARVQGAAAGESISAAIRSADALGVDVILVVRGGGARTDLAAFDLEVVARAIALASVPVFTGIGHEVDTSIADMVAHSRFKTPTAAAAAICGLVAEAIDEIEDSWRTIAEASVAHLDSMEHNITTTASRLERVSIRHLNRQNSEVQSLVHHLQFVSRTRLGNARIDLDDAWRRVSTGTRRSIELSGHQLEMLAARARAHDPQLALARGWSITRRSDGTVVRSVEHLEAGESLSTLVADGNIRSVVQATSPTNEEPGINE